MKLWIETDALEGSDTTLLWKGALFGLNYLRRFGHYCSFNVADLSEAQQKLIHNEELATESFKKKEADFIVKSQEKQLLLKEAKGESRLFDDWMELSAAICFPSRKADYHRETSETDITVQLNLDGSGKAAVETGLGFLDHMLEQIAKHGLIDLSVQCNGDLNIDEHHTIEDVAIALGTTIAKALGHKRGINRYGFSLPMDESAATVLLDLSGRPYLVFEGTFNREKVGDFPTEMVEHFFYSLAVNLRATLHITVKGDNDHHQIEACFKSFARCLRSSISRNERNLHILPSTKDLL